MPEPPMTPSTALVMSTPVRADWRIATVRFADDRPASSVCSLSHKEKDGVRGLGLSRDPISPHPNPLPTEERERTEYAALASHLWLAHARGYSLGGRGLSFSGCNSTS